MNRYPDLYGSEGDEEGEEGAEGKEGEGTEEEPEPRTLTAKELDDIVARAAGRSGRKATKDLAKELGFESVAAMKETVADMKKARDEARSADEQAREEAEAEKEAVAKERATLRTERLGLAIQRGIVATGITDDKKVSRITALLRDDLEPDLEEEEWAEAVTGAVEAIKADMPELFAAAKGSAGSGDGGAKGASTKDAEAEEEEKWSKEYAEKGLGVPSST